VPAQFDHEKLDVYQLTLQFVAWSSVLLDDIRKSGVERTAEVRDQLDRASLSILLNLAEGNAKRHLRVRAKFFDDARGSATECAACLDAAVAKRACVPNDVVPGKEMLIRIVAMLTRLVEVNSDGDRVREEPEPYGEGTSEK
jgi:four helix bundle protein